jgi:uncharacterized repeat protein (TIGR03803 family)
MSIVVLMLSLTALPAAAQTFSVIHVFNGNKTDGSSPQAGLIADSTGNLYGTAAYGGLLDFGIVFELPVTGGEKILHNFTSNWDGAFPRAGLTLDPAGNLYGTAGVGGFEGCGDIGCGLVFKLSPDGKEAAPHIFKGQSDGGFPLAGVIRDSLGNLYGTAGADGIFTGACVPYGCGVVFKIDPAGHESVLHGFTGPPDGNGPVTQLVRDANGNLYGATEWGGSNGCNNGTGCGMIFKLDPAGHEIALYTFTGGADGGTPSRGSLAIDALGNLYGATSLGGYLSCSLGKGLGCGVVFKVDPAGNETVLYAFHGMADGGLPMGGVDRDSNGNLYGTASQGGDVSGSCTSVGCGVVFKLSPSGRQTVLHSFHFTDGAAPLGTLLLRQGIVYGTTVGGGSYAGVVFQLRP